MKRPIYFVLSCIAGLMALSGASAAHIDVEFSNFAVGTTFPFATLPRTITADGVDIALSPGASRGSARIIDTQLFGSPNPGLFLAAGARAQIQLPAPSTGGFFFFRNQGGTNLLEVNGQTLNFTNSALAGDGATTLGGVGIHSSLLSGFYRSVKLDGTINTLAFIGAELNIDSIDLTLVPEPPTILLLTIVVASIAASRRRPASQDRI